MIRQTVPAAPHKVPFIPFKVGVEATTRATLCRMTPFVCKHYQIQKR